MSGEKKTLRELVTPEDARTVIALIVVATGCLAVLMGAKWTVPIPDWFRDAFLVVVTFFFTSKIYSSRE